MPAVAVTISFSGFGGSGGCSANGMGGSGGVPIMRLGLWISHVWAMPRRCRPRVTIFPLDRRRAANAARQWRLRLGASGYPASRLSPILDNKRSFRPML